MIPGPVCKPLRVKQYQLHIYYKWPSQLGEFSSVNPSLLFFSINLNICLGAQKNCSDGSSAHKISFGLEIRTINVNYVLLTRVPHS